MSRALRFAVLIRVSTEKQERQGESLRTQERQIQDAVAHMGATITKRYAGQEHATEGWERQQLDQLLADAELSPKPFDAIMVAHPDRWSRDNIKSEQGLNTLYDNGVLFFILTQEQDLSDENVRLYLAMSAAIGKYHAARQARTSLVSRIERAKRGIPTAGNLPYGRTFDKLTEQWGIDPEAQTLVRDVAVRYLAGESMAKLAAEYEKNHSFLHKTITTGCGTAWDQRFRSKKNKIDETVRTTVPALLEPELIAAVQRRAAGNKTFSHGPLVHQYLLSRMVFCGKCGYAMSGEMGPHGKQYYRHQSRNGAAQCPLKIRASVPANVLETTVLALLADLWGNPKAVEKALADAEPNKAEIAKCRERMQRIEDELTKIKNGRERILAFIIKETITEGQAGSKLQALKEREARLNEETEFLRQRLGGTLSPVDRERLAKQVVAARKRAGSLRRDVTRAAEDPEKMTWKQKRALVEDVFGGTMPDGRRMGVYASPLDVGKHQKHRRWSYEIHGRIEEHGILDDSRVTEVTRYSRY